MTKIHAFGTTIGWDSAGGTSYTDIGQVSSITGPGLSRETIDVTTHDSASWWREFIKSLKDGGEVSFDIMYDPVLGTHDYSTGLLSDFADDDTVAAWRLVFPDAANTTWTFPGIITGAESSEAIDDVLKMSITIKVAGAPTLA